ncbi:MAG: hypothetical protein QXF88_00650 [Candidatus Aenigmatarchaeota archaeon]
MCKRIGLMYAIENGLFDGYDSYFQNRGIDPNSVTLALEFSTQQRRYQVLDPIHGTWKTISDRKYQALVDGRKTKFPGRRTK